MRIVVYDAEGRVLEKQENILVPKPSSHLGELYIFYESMGFTVVSRIKRELGAREAESIVAVKTGKHLYLYENLPQAILERLGVEKEGLIIGRVKLAV